MDRVRMLRYPICFVVLVVILFWSWRGTAVKLDQFAGLADIGALVEAMFPADLSADTLRVILRFAVETIQIALLGTVGGAILALPLSLLAAARGRVSRLPVQSLFYALQVVPTLIWVPFLRILVGMGSLAAILALAVHGSGVLGGLYTAHLAEKRSEEVVPSAEPKSLRTALRDAVSQAWRGFLPLIFQQWQSNNKEAVILGFLGGGGIGLVFVRVLSSPQYFDVMPVVLGGIALMVVGIDGLSALIRRLAFAPRSAQPIAPLPPDLDPT